MDLYLKGVLESESGLGRPIEYYKVQSIISRTYALKYFKSTKNKIIIYAIGYIVKFI